MPGHWESDASRLKIDIWFADPRARAGLLPHDVKLGVT